ncbi:hypothetical protein C0J52_01867 [Blattella germanica]|nr:hypothetical protein C0J52_01867 [Blattella germanica]
MARETQHTSRNNYIKVNSLFYAFSNTNRLLCSKNDSNYFRAQWYRTFCPHPLPSRNRIYCRVAFDL